MSRSCQSATFSRPDLGVAAQDPRQAGDPLAGDRVALVRHRRRALLSGPKGLLDLADLGSLQVADLGREALQPRPGECDGREQLRVAVARHDLGGHVLGADPERLADAPLDRGRHRRVGADGARHGAHRGLCERSVQAGQVAVGLEGEPRETQAEGRGLGVHAVGPARRRGSRRAPAPGRATRRDRPWRRRPGSRRRRGSAGPARCRGRRRTSGRSGSSAPPPRSRRPRRR